MSKEGNPYTNLLKMMRNEGYNKDTNMVIGKVTKLSPLEVSVGNFLLAQEDMFVAEHLMDRKQEISITSGSTTIQRTEMNFYSPLKIGDSVMILIDKSDFYLINKVVK